MSIQEIIYLITFILVPFGLAFLLFKRVDFFRRALGFISLIVISGICVLLHNLFSAATGKEEAVFFILVFLSGGAGIFLFFFWLVKLFRGAK